MTCQRPEIRELMPRLQQLVLLVFRHFGQPLITILDAPFHDPTIAFSAFDSPTNPDSTFMNPITQLQSSSGARPISTPGQLPFAYTQMHTGNAPLEWRHLSMTTTGYGVQQSAPGVPLGNSERGRQLVSTSASNAAAYSQENRFSPYPMLGSSSSRRRSIPGVPSVPGGPDDFMSGMGIPRADESSWNASDPSFASSTSFDSYTSFPLDPSADLSIGAPHPFSLDPAFASTTRGY